MLSIYEFEKQKLYSILGDCLVSMLKDHKAYIAGGLITSLFCNREINDVDIYFKDKKSFADFIYEMWEEVNWAVAHTKKSTLFKYHELDIQLIHFKFFETPDNIFDTFDFTACMGCFDFETEQFVLHQDFLRHNSQRLLEFNPNTAYPLVSALRVQKYEKKGYKISKTEYLKILFACMDLEVNSYDELKEHIGGMYGINYDRIFDDEDDSEFSLQKAIQKVSNLHLSEDYFKQPESLPFNDIDDILDNILGKELKYIIHNGYVYRIAHNNQLKNIDNEPKHGTKIDPDEYFKGKKYYKFVKKIDGRYFSFWDSKFEYQLGEIIKPKGQYLYCGEFSDRYDFNYHNSDNAVLIELEIECQNDFGKINSSNNITLKQCKFTREIPEEEWNNKEKEVKDDFWQL